MHFLGTAHVYGDDLNTDYIIAGKYCSICLDLQDMATHVLEAVYATGAGMSNMILCYPDMGLASMSEMLENTRRMVDAISIPLIVDIDNAYGNQINVARTVREFCKAGAAALQMEDQVMPKKCGHFAGKLLVSQAEMVAKIKAAKDFMGDDALLIARTDAIAVHGFEDALERANAYVEAGADILFIEAPTSPEQMRRIPQIGGVPHIINLVEGGLTPLLSQQELKELGYRIALYANAPLKGAIKGLRDVLDYLKVNGSTAGGSELMISTKERNRLTDVDYYYEIERKYSVK